MTDLFLSIITVTKNCAGTINNTLASVSAIKQPGIEYIVIDGASTDETLAIIHARDKLVDRLISEPDTGIYNAMNKGVQLARGRYVLFINGDDELVSDGFPAAIEAITRNKAEIICATTLTGSRLAPDEALIAVPHRLLFFNSVPHPSSFVCRELLLSHPFREDLRIASDYDFFLAAYLAKKSFSVLPAVTALHQRGGASGNVERSQRELEEIRRLHLGWRYPAINGIAAFYRRLRSVIPKRFG